MIDPPSVNMGEYVPFWWKMSDNDDVKFVEATSCSSASLPLAPDLNKTYILNKGTSQPICKFVMSNGI
jgi:hypothetical protein